MNVPLITLVRWYIEDMIRDHFGTVLRVFSKQAFVAGKNFKPFHAIYREILLLLYLGSLIRKKVHGSLTIGCNKSQMLSMNQVAPSFGFPIQSTKSQTNQPKKMSYAFTPLFGKLSSPLSVLYIFTLYLFPLVGLDTQLLYKLFVHP